jgi:type IV pilus assembly protein PilN
VLLIDRFIDAAIDRQAARNMYVQNEIDQLDTRLRQLDELRSQRQQLLERMHVIQGLQGNRSTIGRLFEQLSRSVPEGVYFTSVNRVGKSLSISGVAESNNQVSALMRGLESSPWLEAPSLTQVKATGTDEAVRGNTFQLTVRQSPAPSAESAR